MTRHTIEQLQQNPDLVERNPGLLMPADGASLPCNTTSFASEAKFQQAIIKEAKRCGWPKIYHTLNSEGSEFGFPDFIMLRPTKDDEFVEAVVLECKMPGKKLTKAQAEWLELLNQVPGIRARVVWPSDIEDIKRMLE